MKTNEELFRVIIEDGFSKGNAAVLNEIAAPDFLEHQSGIVPPNAEGVKRAIATLHNAFPDFSLTVEELVSHGDTVWGRMTARGTQRGQIGPLFPTGKPMQITVIDIMRFREGKLVEHWGVADRLSMMEQLGMKPPPKFIMKLLSFWH
ncbi:MAG TPA: ester cyclase [Terriglobales bacterium]|nr:ester cyclase [Terriglobales bacterium]